jgi:hypothetical protein
MFKRKVGLWRFLSKEGILKVLKPIILGGEWKHGYHETKDV